MRCPLPQFLILVEMMLVLFVWLFVFLFLVLRNISKLLVWAAVVALKREDIKGSLPRKTPADTTHSQTQFGCGLLFGKGMWSLNGITSVNPGKWMKVKFLDCSCLWVHIVTSTKGCTQLHTTAHNCTQGPVQPHTTKSTLQRDHRAGTVYSTSDDRHYCDNPWGQRLLCQNTWCITSHCF